MKRDRAKPTLAVLRQRNTELYEGFTRLYEAEKLRYGKNHTGMPTVVLSRILRSLLHLADARQANWNEAIADAMEKYILDKYKGEQCQTTNTPGR